MDTSNDESLQHEHARLRALQICEFSNYLAQLSFVFGCGLSASAGNLLNLFSPFGKNRPVRVICRAGKRPEITVHVDGGPEWKTARVTQLLKFGLGGSL